MNFCTKIVLVLYCLFLISFKKTSTSQKYVKIDQNVYISTTEVSNIQYRAFLEYLITSHQTSLYQRCIYDSSQWNTEPMKEYYHRHVAYHQYPVVNITHEAMEAYCEWINDQDEAKRNVKYRLPTANEWKNAYILGYTAEKFNKTQSKYFHHDTVFDGANIKNPTQTNVENMPAPVYAYPPNKIGIYNLIGNVCEYNSDGAILGGSWDQTFRECSVNQTQQYSLPNLHVGFRIVKEIIKK